jgi:hypothetical protein
VFCTAVLSGSPSNGIPGSSFGNQQVAMRLTCTSSQGQTIIGNGETYTRQSMGY